MEFITNNAQGTKKIAIKLVEGIAQKKNKSALVFGLTGELGAGKTTFIQGLAKALKIKERVLSPTFVIIRRYDIKNRSTYFKRNKCSAEHKRKSFVLWSKTKNWSDYVTKHSFALDLEEGVFTWDDPRKIAESLKKSAKASLHRKGTPFQSAMSMLNF